MWTNIGLRLRQQSYLPPFSICSFGYWFLFGGCGLALMASLVGFEWCSISLFFILGFSKSVLCFIDLMSFLSLMTIMDSMPFYVEFN